MERIAAIPSVESAAVVPDLPLRGAMQTGFRLPGDPNDALASTRQNALLQFVSPEYFQTLRIPVVSGRVFRADDVPRRAEVAIVNQEFVRPFFGRQRSRRSSTPSSAPGPDHRRGWRRPHVGRKARRRTPDLSLLHAGVRAEHESDCPVPAPTSRIVSHVKGAIRSVYTDQAIFNVLTMQEVFSNSVAEPRFQACLIGAFALLALLMAASGMYSVIACLVGQRASEIGIRIALGATRRSIVGAVLGMTTLWILAGLLASLGTSLVAAGAVQKLSQAAIPAMPESYCGGCPVLDRAITDFVEWYCSEPRLAFNRTVVLQYRVYLEQRQYAATTINRRLAAVHRVAYEACRFRSPQPGTGRRNSTSKGSAPDRRPRRKLAYSGAEQATVSWHRQVIPTWQEELCHSRDVNRMRIATRRVARVTR